MSSCRDLSTGAAQNTYFCQLQGFGIMEKLVLDTGNTGFTDIFAASLAMLMTPGLAFFYGGLVGRKNVLAIIIQSYVSMGWTTALWYICGYSLCFSGTQPRRRSGIIGNLDCLSYTE